MDAGLLNRRIVIEERQTEDDEFGEPIEKWLPVAKVWANYRPTRGNEGYAAAQRFAEVQAKFHIRFRRDVTPTHRIAFDGRLWDIIEVLETGLREGLDILAKARAE